MNKTVQLHQKEKNGFSLIETAIILAVVGLVIGGIWVAAAQVSYNRKVSDTASAVAQAAVSVRHIFSQLPCPGGSTTLNPGAYDLGPLSNWQRGTGAYSNVAFSPLGPGIMIQVACGASGYGGNDTIAVVFTSTPKAYTQSMCLAVTPRLGFRLTANGYAIEDNAFYALGGSGYCTTGMSSLSYYWKYR